VRRSRIEDDPVHLHPRPAEIHESPSERKSADFKRLSDQSRRSELGFSPKSTGIQHGIIAK
jgi:hypothetical protein